MAYSFDTVIDRRNTGSVKFDLRHDLLPLWVADMDFPLPDEILSAIKKRVDHGIFGYTMTTSSYWNALDKWCNRQYGYSVDPEHAITVPGVVYALALAVRTLTEPGDAVLIEQPVYYPFRQIVEINNRKVVNVPLRYSDGRYSHDINALERVIKTAHPKAFLLCSPHNPVGRVWSREELLAVGTICKKYNVAVVADEIHCDFIRPGYTFTSWNTLPEEYKRQFILCIAPSKTFNLAGLQVSNVIIPDPDIRDRFKKENQANGYNEINVLGMTAAEACYSYGLPWLDQLRKYLEENITFVSSFLKEHMREVHLVEPEGTYLLWLDFHGCNMTNKQMKERVEQSGLWLDHGDLFGPEGDLFERINIACPRKILEQAMERLAQ